MSRDWAAKRSRPFPVLMTPESRRAIEVLESADSVVLFYGAGLGAEAGLPSWNLLVKRLVMRAIAHVASHEQNAESAFPADSHAEIAARIVDVEGTLPAATLARTRLLSPGGRTGFESVLRECLYQRGEDNSILNGEMEFEPGPLSRDLAQLVRAALKADKSVQLVTTNYDPLTFNALDQALGDDVNLVRVASNEVAGLQADGHWQRFVDRDFTVVPDLRPRADGSLRPCVPVVFLHGYLYPGRTNDDAIADAPIFSEAEYFFESQEQGWQEGLLSGWLRGDVGALFLGAGLNDPDILRMLYKFAHTNSHGIIALRPRQRRLSGVASDEPAVCEVDEQLHEELSLARWKAANVSVLPHDYYYEQASFVRELRRAIESGPDMQEYSARREAWYALFCEQKLGLPPTETPAPGSSSKSRNEAFAAREVDGDYSAMVATRDAIDAWSREIVDQQRPELRGFAESLAIHVWSLFPSDYSLAMTFATDRVWKDLCAIARRPVWKPTQFAAVEAFCDGDVRVRELPGASGQFGLIIGVPVILDDEQFGGLQVGVCVVASTAQKPTSGLWQTMQTDAAHRRRVIGALQDLGRRLLTPTGVVDLTDEAATESPTVTVQRSEESA